VNLDRHAHREWGLCKWRTPCHPIQISSCRAPFPAQWRSDARFEEVQLEEVQLEKAQLEKAQLEKAQLEA